MSQNEDKDFQAAHEMGKIYSSFLDKKLLCDFFLESAMMFVKASEGYLFLAAQNDKLWLETKMGQTLEERIPKVIEAEAQQAYKEGKPLIRERALFLPLIVRNHAIGIATLYRNSSEPVFNQKDLALATDLAWDIAGSLKNIMLHEENIKMERLAAMGQTVGMVMHEMKNILQLGTFSHELLNMGMEKNNPKSVGKGLKGLSKMLRELDGFIYELLSLTKDYKMSPQPFNLQTLFDELLEDLSDRAKAHNIALEFKSDPAIGEAEGEARSLYRSLLNMVKNAMEACDKDSSFIRLTGRNKDQETYQIIIEDNGQGMSDEVKAKLFQAFFSTKGAKGTGLGLLVIDKTIKSHKGEIQVDSEVGKGTTFTITLPKKIAVD